MTEYEEYESSAEADTSLYVVHCVGPDDVYPARSWREAVELAHGINASVAEYVARTESDGLVRAWATPYLRSDAVAAGVIRGGDGA